jgi:hypothetical protein
MKHGHTTLSDHFLHHIQDTRTRHQKNIIAKAFSRYPVTYAHVATFCHCIVSRICCAGVREPRGPPFAGAQWTITSGIAILTRTSFCCRVANSVARAGRIARTCCYCVECMTTVAAIARTSVAITSSVIVKASTRPCTLIAYCSLFDKIWLWDSH